MPTDNTNNDLIEGQMSLMDHLMELRNRIVISIIVFVVLFLACLIKIGDPSSSISDHVYIFLQKPLADLLAERGGRMIFTGLHEGFFTQIKVAFLYPLKAFLKTLQLKYNWILNRLMMMEIATLMKVLMKLHWRKNGRPLKKRQGKKKSKKICNAEPP